MEQRTLLQQTIEQQLPQIERKFDELLHKHSSLHIGGAAEVMLFPKTERELADILTFARNEGENVRILGAGTNILAPDEGVRGIVVCLKNALRGREMLDDRHIRVYAGETMANAAVFAAEHGLSGLEFAHGIPGTVGGGVYMNAGAYGGEIADVCTLVAVTDQNGNRRLLGNAEMGFSYRNSRAQREDLIVIYAEFALDAQPAVDIQAKMQLLREKRSASQPLDAWSAGSAFKRPATGYAAALIDEAGLKGFRVGGAAISEKHAGFAVNLGDATAEDMKQLLRQVADRVEARSGVRLEPEIRIW